MSVNWSCVNVRDWETLHADDLEWEKTSILLTAGWGYGWFDSIGFGSITEANVGEVWVRMNILQSLVGAPLSRWTGKVSEPIYFTKDDIIRRIGLSSNYSTKSHAVFMKGVKAIMDAKAKEIADSVQKQLANA